MARRKSRSRKVPKKITAKFHPIVSESTPSYYSNYIEVGHSPYEFVMTFAKVPTRPKPEHIRGAIRGEPIPVEAILQVEVPTRLLEGLINALSIQMQKYEKSYGRIKPSK